MTKRIKEEMERYCRHCKKDVTAFRYRKTKKRIAGEFVAGLLLGGTPIGGNPKFRSPICNKPITSKFAHIFACFFVIVLVIFAIIMV